MTDRTDLGYGLAEQITRQRAKSFAFASIALDAPTRRAAFAIYAFCRRCDDEVDGASGASERGPERARESAGGGAEAARGVARLREELAAAYVGDDRGDPLLAAFSDTVRNHGVPREALLGLIDGMEQDLSVKRYETWNDLLQYCELAAGTVGQMMAAIFGVRDPDALAPASALGRAMQLTNVMRDVREDFEVHGRIYLPLEALRARGLTENHVRAFSNAGRLGEGRDAAAFRDLMREAALRARFLYRFADRGVPAIPAVAGRACTRLMRSSYAGILDVLEARRWDPFLGRARTSTPRKLGAGVRAVLFPEVSP